MLGHFLLNSDDLGETEEILGANFAEIRISASATGSSTRARVWRRNVGSLTIDEAEYGYDMSFDMAPPEEILLCRIRSGGLQERQPREDRTIGPNEVATFGALDGVPFSGSVRHARYDLLAVPRSLLGEVAEDPTVRLTSSIPVSRDANRLLVEAIDYVRHGVLANPHAAQAPLISGALSRYLAATMLSALPHGTRSVMRPGSLPETSPARLRQAIAFIDDNAHTDISVADIAKAVDMTPQSMRSLFRRYRDCTPTDYLQRVRLHHAHRDLDAALCSTVTEVAHRWGFLNVERFTLAYLKAYGHPPHADVRRSGTRPNDP